MCVRYLVLLFMMSVSNCANSSELLFSYITSVTGQFRIINARPVVDLALEEINSRTDVLENYTLNYNAIHNSKCSASGALDSFFKDFPHTSEAVIENKFVALLCCGCPNANFPVAEISHYWNIPQISFTSSDEKLAESFESFFQPLPSLQRNSIALVEVVRKFGWRQMAVVSQMATIGDDHLLTDIMRDLRREFTRERWVLDDSSRFPENRMFLEVPGAFPLDRAFRWMTKGDFRVIYINAYPEYTFMILCHAYTLRLLPPRYVWITPIWENRKWWKPISEMITFACTESQLLQVLIGSIGIVPDGYFVMENETAETFSGRTPMSFTNEYKRLLKQPQYERLKELGIAGVAYDTVWSIALGLDRAVERINDNNDTGCENRTGELVPLEDFDYTNEKMGCILYQSFREIKFIGITGSISYGSDGTRTNNISLVQQYRVLENGSVERETVADVVFQDSGTAHIFMFRDGENETTLWKSGVPYDGVSLEIIHDNNTVLVGFLYALAAIGILFTIACLLFNIIFRKRRLVKLSSPNLNYLIIIGAVCLYACVIIAVTPINDEVVETIMCNMGVIVFSVGYTLCFAVVLAKTWRIYYIFDNPTMKKKRVTDWILLLIIAAIVALDWIVLLISTAVPSSRLVGERVVDGEKSQSITKDGINQDYYIFVCSSGPTVVWLWISFGYKALLQIAGVFMAFHIRKIKIKALNDSKEIAAIIYINNIMLVLLIVAVFLLEEYHNAYAALFGFTVFIQATLFIGILFIPKAIGIYRDPHGTKIFSTARLSGIAASQINGKALAIDDLINDPNNAMISDLKQKVKNLEEALAEKTTKGIDQESSIQ